MSTDAAVVDTTIPKAETDEAGARFLHAVGVTLSELGESLQRHAEDEQRGTAA